MLRRVGCKDRLCGWLTGSGWLNHSFLGAGWGLWGSVVLAPCRFHVADVDVAWLDSDVLSGSCRGD